MTMNMKQSMVRIFMLSVICIFTTGFAGSKDDVLPSHPFKGKVRLVLPKVIYGIVGIEMNVYFDNVVLVLNPDNYAFKIICKKGICQSERWTFMPQAGDIGEIPFQLEVLDQNNTVVARAQSVIKILPADVAAGEKVTMLCVGDSLTHQAFYTQQLLDLCTGAGNPLLTLIGSHQGDGATAANVHEGYGGWTAEVFVTRYSDVARTGAWQQRGSPFLYLGPDNKPALDFAQYCRDVNNGKSPDIVTIFLGINDVVNCTDADIDSQIDKILKYYDQLITMVHAVNKDTKIGVVLIPPPAASQDAFGANTGCIYNRWQYRRNQHHMVERLIEHFGDHEKDNIFLIPVYINLDCVHNYPMNNVPWNSHATNQGIRQVNALHPAKEGYCQIGDTFYCWLKAVMQKTKKN